MKNGMTVLSNQMPRIATNGGGTTFYSPQVLSAQDYYPFGMLMPGRVFNASDTRHGWGGHEMVNEVSGIGNHYTAEFWEYDPRTGRRWNIDPVYKHHLSNYSIMSGNPIARIDPDGANDDWVQKKNGEVYWDDNATSQATTKKDETYLSADKFDKKVSDAIGSHIINSSDKMGTFTNYIENNRLGKNYFIDAANTNYSSNASGFMQFALNNTIGAADGILISEMTHDWVNQSSLGNNRAANATEHHIGMFLLSDKYGPKVAANVGNLNEIRGLLIDDRQNNNLWQAISGNPARNGGNTAFEWSDLRSNEAGINFWKSYRNYKPPFNPGANLLGPKL